MRYTRIVDSLLLYIHSLPRPSRAKFEAADQGRSEAEKANDGDDGDDDDEIDKNGSRGV